MKTQNHKKIDSSRKKIGARGFTILFAVLVSTLVLALGAGIANITLKEISLSGTGRESQFAFYAADTGAECALYWDFHLENAFATSSSSVAPGGVSMPCAGENIIDTWVFPTQEEGLPADYPAPDAQNATTTFYIDSGGTCATVQVGKHDTDGDGIPDVTVIDSRGYNTCNTASGVRIERGLRISY